MFPEEVRQRKQQGEVVLRVIVAKDGSVYSAEVQRTSDPVFNENAIETVKRWQFQPATKDGEPVAVLINVEVSFRLQ